MAKIIGTDDDDTLSGTDSADTIQGLGGNDTIVSNGGADLLYGGVGDDMIVLGRTGAYAYGQDGDDRFVVQNLAISSTPTTIDGGDGVDTFDASRLVGSENDYLDLQFNFNTGKIEGGGYILSSIEVFRSPDFVEVGYFLGDAPVTIYGGSGNELVSTEGQITFSGGGGDDSIFLNTSGSRASGGSGNDIFSLEALGGATDIRIDGGEGKDEIYVSADAVDLRRTSVLSIYGVRYAIKGIEDADVRNAHDGATLTGNDGANALTLRPTADGHYTINGLGGDDLINGSDHDDSIFGGDGDDFVTGFTGFDRIDGGEGHDFASFGASEAGPLSIRLLETGTTSVMAGGETVGRIKSIEDVGGSQVSDSIQGNSLDNQLVGNGGDDRLNGGLGDDTLNGGAGKDALAGGDGADRFQFDRYTESAPSRASADIVADFHQAEGDQLVFSFDASPTIPGDQHFAFIGQDAFSGTSGELRFDIVGSATFVSADTNGDGRADMTIRLLGAIELTAADFVL